MQTVEPSAELEPMDLAVEADEPNGIATLHRDTHIAAEAPVDEKMGDLDNRILSGVYSLMPMVALGGSAGSISALQTFFGAMPAHSGMCFVVILHLSPDHDSTLAELLQHSTKMRVRQATDWMKVEEDCVYVIPPGKHFSSGDGHLRLTPLEPIHGRRVAVDLFFRTLAETHGPHAVAIVLSGADGDGAIGLKRIKERGGLTIAQDPGEAQHDSMPRSAIATGMVDWILRVGEIPGYLLEYAAREQRLRLPPEERSTETAPRTSSDEAEDGLRDVLAFLRARTGRDFSCYKRPTIVRRLTRRMQVIGVDDLPAYLAYLGTHRGEAAAMLQDLLIPATNFFRDPEAFAALETLVPSLFTGKTSRDVVRVWVGACATGEEAYSIAMLLFEHVRTLDDPPAIQIFATDLDPELIHLARQGVYPATIVADVSESRLRQFFEKEHEGYRVRREIREIVLFAVHDHLKDSPFSRLDLVSCRNLLIYLDRDAQRRGLDTSHFVLRPDGLLSPGSSELVDEGNENFCSADEKKPLYPASTLPRATSPVSPGPTTLDFPGLTAVHLGLDRRGFDSAYEEPPSHATPRERSPWGELHLEMIEWQSPPSVLVNRENEILHMTDRAGEFLKFASGEPTRDILRLVHPTLRIELRAALLRAAEAQLAVEIEGIPMEVAGEMRSVNLRVVPVGDPSPGSIYVQFESRARPEHAGESGAPPAASHSALLKLDAELERMQTCLRHTVEEYKASSGELKASNEELKAMNGELRSATEELKTSREELQFINEELITANQELKGKVDEISRANTDLQNLMASTQTATIFLDGALQVKRYTPAAVAIFNLIPSDLGRPLSDLAARLDYPGLTEDAVLVLRDLVPIEREVSQADERCFLVRLLPYRTLEDLIAGVVLTFVDITERKRSEEALRKSEERFSAICNEINTGVCQSEFTGEFTYANPAFCRILGRTEAEVLALRVQDVTHPDDLKTNMALYDRLGATGEPFEVDKRYIRKDGSTIWVSKRVNVIRNKAGGMQSAVGLVFDISSRRAGAAALLASEGLMQMAMRATHFCAWEISLVPGTIIYSSEAAEVFGFETLPPEFTRLETWFSRIHPEDRNTLRRAISGLSTSRHIDFEFRLLADDRTLWMEAHGTPIYNEEGVPIRVVGVTKDITDRKRTEEALRVTNERLRLLVENAREYGIFAADQAGLITTWTFGAERLLGYSEDEILGQNAEIIYTPEDRAGKVPALEMQAALAEGRATDERWHLRKDGGRFWASGHLMAMQDSEGHAIGFVKILRDQTEAREAQQALEQSQTELWAALQETEAARNEMEATGRAKDHFMAVLSHELRTPLTPVLMAVQILARRKDLPLKVMEALEMIRRNVQIEAHFIDDLLDLTKISRGKLEFVRERMDLHAAIRSAVGISQVDLDGKGQLLTVNLAATRFFIVGDGTRVPQVFWNLLKNASKFSPNGGAVRVESRNEGDRIVVTVIDTGIGIEAEAISRIFDAFDQANLKVTREYGGLGLGLAIAKATVEGLRGTLRAESPGPGQGSTFIVDLPLENGSTLGTV